MSKPKPGDVVWTIARPDEANDPFGYAEPWEVKIVELFPGGSATVSAFRHDGSIDDDTNCTVTAAPANRWWPNWRMATTMYVKALLSHRNELDLAIIDARIALAKEDA